MTVWYHFGRFFCGVFVCVEWCLLLFVPVPVPDYIRSLQARLDVLLKQLHENTKLIISTTEPAVLVEWSHFLNFIQCGRNDFNGISTIF